MSLWIFETNRLETAALASVEMKLRWWVTHLLDHVGPE
jgi:hypothetical protein